MRPALSRVFRAVQAVTQTDRSNLVRAHRGLSKVAVEFEVDVAGVGVDGGRKPSVGLSTGVAVRWCSSAAMPG
jgi:hypothetical protein